MAHQKANPRPPSSSGRKVITKTGVPPKKSMLAQNSDDDYSEDNYDENDFDDAADEEADKKLENLRKALKREN